MMAKLCEDLERAGHQDARRHHRAAARSPDAAPHTRPGSRSSTSGNRPATSAASAPTSARAFCSAIPSSRTRAMRSLLFGQSTEKLVAATLYCCECNLCTMFACPEDLDPKNVCVQGKPAARELGMTYKGPVEDIAPHPMGEYRRVPTKRLMLKLGLMEFNNEGPLVDLPIHPQARDAPAQAACRSAGDRYGEGRRPRARGRPDRQACGRRIGSADSFEYRRRGPGSRTAR